MNTGCSDDDCIPFDCNDSSEENYCHSDSDADPNFGEDDKIITDDPNIVNVKLLSKVKTARL